MPAQVDYFFILYLLFLFYFILEVDPMCVHYLEYHVYSCLLYVYQAFNK